MTTPTSGQISLSQIRDVFNGAGQVSFSQCQSGGSLAADTVTSTPSGTVPNTGSQGTFSDFYSPLTGQLSGRFDSIGGSTILGGETWVNRTNFIDGSTGTYAYHGHTPTNSSSNYLHLYNWSKRSKLPSDATITNLKWEMYCWISQDTDGNNGQFLSAQYSSDTMYDPAVPWGDGDGNPTAEWVTTHNCSPSTGGVTQANAREALTYTSDDVDRNFIFRSVSSGQGPANRLSDGGSDSLRYYDHLMTVDFTYA
jgi:hypothetical protein